MVMSALVLSGLNLWGFESNHEQDILQANASNFDLLLSKSLRIISIGNRTVKRSVSPFLSISPETMVWLSSMLCLVILLAFATNPSDSSFRSYLTDNVLRRHMQAFRQDAFDAAHDSADESDSIHALTKNEASRAALPSHRFTNRITISLRTPAYDKSDYGLFSTSTVVEEKSQGAAEKTLHIGLFGKWWRLSSWEARKGLKAAGWGISNIRAIDTSEGDESFDTSRNDRLQDEAAESSTGTSERVLTKKKRSAASGKHRAESQSPSVKSKDASTSYDAKIGEGNASTRSGSGQAAPSGQSSFGDASPAAGSIGQGGNGTELAENAAESYLQLEQIRSISDVARKNLQAQLEELRGRKRDEDAARLDVKGRMKALDEHKRQAEATKREAERRLKQANVTRDNFKNRLAAKTQEMSSLRKKESTIYQKVQSSASEKDTMVRELNKKLEEEEKRQAMAEADLKIVKERLERLQESILEEEGNLEAAREMASEHYSLAGDQSFGSHIQHDIGPYSSHQGVQPFEIANHYSNAPDAGPGTAETSMYGNDSAAGQRWQPTFSEGPIAPQPRSLALVASMMDDAGPEAHAGSPLDAVAFDPTLSESDAELMAQNRFSPFSFDQNNVLFNHGIDRNLAQSRLSSATPLSPFQSDLLPSNLFQNADEDERHAGILPGTHSDRVEAALNRFGLDTSDVSDLGSNQDDVEVRSEAGESIDKVSTTSSTRGSWWSGRRRSKERDGQGKAHRGESMKPLTDSQVEQEDGKDVGAAALNKRRSMSIFPKLTLNPSAKSFRGSTKRGNQHQKMESEEDSQSSDLQTPSALGAADPLLRRAWNSSLGSLPSSQHDYETLRRAFEADGALSRASLDVQNPSNEQRWNAQINRGWPSHLRPSAADGQANGAPRSSSDSVRNAFAGYSNPASASTDWLDDIIMPIQARASSEALRPRTEAASSHTPPSRFGFLSSNSSKPSRFALWRSGSRDGTDVSSQSKADESSEKSDAESGSLASKASQTGDETVAVGAANLTSPSASKAKRTSFLWPSRKSEMASSATDTTEGNVDKQIN
jgi:hypothetical protein